MCIKHDSMTGSMACKCNLPTEQMWSGSACGLALPMGWCCWLLYMPAHSVLEVLQVGSGEILLSGGQKQRVAIARAIIKDPKVCTCPAPSLMGSSQVLKGIVFLSAQVLKRTTVCGKGVLSQVSAPMPSIWVPQCCHA